MSEYQMIIDGQKVDTDAHFPVLNPATEEVIAQCPRATEQDLNRAVDAARAAFPAWSARPDAERAEMVHAIGAALEAHAGELAGLLVREQGKPLGGFAGLGAQFELGGTVAWCHATADLELPVEVIQDNDEARIEVHRKPLGVVGSITPWNYPLLIAIWHTMPALRSGNTVVIKPSEFTPLTTLRAAEIINDILPPGVFNIVTGDGSLGAAMTNHPGINKIVFTGSTPTGKKIMQGASGNLKRLTLELGGNDAAIVLPDVDVAAVAPKIFATALINNGQTCAALKRLYVHEDIYDELCQALADIAGSVKTGPGDGEVDFGPVQNKPQFDKVCAIAEEARASGARILTGGQPLPGPGYFFPVTIVADIDENTRLVREEPFGPILPVLKYTDVEDALRRANDSPNGLGGSVWSGDLDRAAALASRLECGTAWVNNHAMIQPDAPFGGVKESGFGVEFGRYGLEEYTSIQTLQISKA
ncbi:aldehyde dehydrogenase family protein [Parahaliea mediterranea]|uniref:Aldehyde dehydrogenase family protein n=1 Tax=Parahaliea mediterranea TaxID=651086 RepID=A0A939DFJ8_9GAMM|nr:aldehyde dehydrogenase family protein [Parahaliea mediterranea]MBN7797345.1 aldehyde dehydrogenase family protein [Parahaliea mediterranea]